MNTCDRLVVNEELEPFVPVSLIDFFGVDLLLVFVCFISDVEDFVDQAGAEPSARVELSILLVTSHLSVAGQFLFDYSRCLMLSGSKHLLFLSDGDFGVHFATLFILVLSQVAILENSSFALASAPYLVVELLLLVGLSLHQLKDHGLTLLLLELVHELLLLTDQSSAALLSVTATALSQGLLGALLEPSGGQSKRARLGCHSHSLCSLRGRPKRTGGRDAHLVGGDTSSHGSFLKALGNRFIGLLLGDTWIDPLAFQSLFKLRNTFVNLSVGFVKHINSLCVVLLGLFVFELRMEVKKLEHQYSIAQAC